jgi:hypothetical protein
MVVHPRSNDTTIGLPEQIHAYCSTVDEVMVKHRIHDAADRIDGSRLCMDLVQGAEDSSKHNEMVQRFYTKHAKSSSIAFLENASTDILKSDPEALASLLTEDYLSTTQ